MYKYIESVSDIDHRQANTKIKGVAKKIAKYWFKYSDN